MPVFEAADRLEAATWPAVLGGDPEAINTALKIMAHRAKMAGMNSTPGTDQGTP